METNCCSNIESVANKIFKDYLEMFEETILTTIRYLYILCFIYYVLLKLISIIIKNS